MHALQNIEPYEIVNASYDADAHFLKEEGYLTHLIGVLTTENNVSDLLEKVPVEAHTWAVFSMKALSFDAAADHGQDICRMAAWFRL